MKFTHFAAPRATLLDRVCDRKELFSGKKLKVRANRRHSSREGYAGLLLADTWQLVRDRKFTIEFYVGFLLTRVG